MTVAAEVFDGILDESDFSEMKDKSIFKRGGMQDIMSFLVVERNVEFGSLKQAAKNIRSRYYTYIKTGSSLTAAPN